MSEVIRSTYEGGSDSVFLLENSSPEADSTVKLRLRAQGANVDITWDGTTLTVPGAGGGIAIGDPVTDGTATCVLFVDGSGNLGQDAGITTLLGSEAWGLSVAAGAYSQVYIQASTGVSTDQAKVVAYGGGSGKTDGEATLICDADGDAKTRYGADDYNIEAAIGLDKSAGKLVASMDTSLGTANIFTADGTTFEVVDVLKINNTVSAEIAAASTHKVAINIGGVDYYALLLAA